MTPLAVTAASEKFGAAESGLAVQIASVIMCLATFQTPGSESIT